jgi:F0F1-type ATP synthase delta subunit
MNVILPALLFLFLSSLFLIYAFRRIMDKNVVSATSHLDELNQDYIKKQQEINRLLEEAKQKSAEVFAQAQIEAQNLKAKIVAQSEKERDAMISAARTQADEIIQQADKARNSLLAEIEERILKEAVKKASDLIQEALPETFRKLAHEHWVDDLLKTGFGQLDKVRIGENINEIRIISAFPLHEEQRKKIIKHLNESLGKDIPVKEEIDVTLVVGLAIHIGSLVLDGSLKNTIKEKAFSAS